MKSNVAFPIVFLAVSFIILAAMRSTDNSSGNTTRRNISPNQIQSTVVPSLQANMRGNGNETAAQISPSNSPQGVQQVDWVYEGTGRCWSAWSIGSCTKLGHEGGIIVPSGRDLNHDGVEDITCSQGDGSKKSSTITNTSDRTISINCEMYSCVACTSGNGTQAQCDGNIDSRAFRLVETINLTPGCTATCTMDGASGSCIHNNPPENTTSTPTPITTIQPNPSNIPTSNTPTLQPTQITQPTNTRMPIPPTATTQPTVRPTATITSPPNNPGNKSPQTLPLFIDYQEYTNGLQGNINGNVTTYVYARGMDTAIGNTSKQAHFERHLNGLAAVRGNVKKIVMTSTLDTTTFLLDNFSDRMKEIGVEYIAMDTERSVLTPEDELRNMESTDPNVNTVAIFAKKAQDKGFKSIWGPIRADGSRIINRTPRAIEAMIGTNCLLDGMAFQEQKQISGQSVESRIQSVSGDSTILKNIAQRYGCTNFHVTMQLMSDTDRCGAEPWTKCKQLVDGVVPHIDSLAIWVNGNNRGDLLNFSNTMRR